MTQRFSLAGKYAVVTGASRGIGFAVAKWLAEAGADIAVCARKEENLAEITRIVRSLGRKVVSIGADLAESESAQIIIDRAAQEFGSIDILVNNAGVSPIFKPVLDTKQAEWEDILKINLTAPMLLSQAAARIMIAAQKGGSIIQMASVAGIVATPRMAAYGAAKAGLIQLTKTMAAELARYQIRVNAIAPGYVQSDLTAALLANPKYAESIAAAAPLGRVGVADEIAGIALYLASNASSFATGQVFTVDGGISAV